MTFDLLLKYLEKAMVLFEDLLLFLEAQAPGCGVGGCGGGSDPTNLLMLVCCIHQARRFIAIMEKMEVEVEPPAQHCQHGKAHPSLPSVGLHLICAGKEKRARKVGLGVSVPALELPVPTPSEQDATQYIRYRAQNTPMQQVVRLLTLERYTILSSSHIDAASSKPLASLARRYQDAVDALNTLNTVKVVIEGAGDEWKAEATSRLCSIRPSSSWALHVTKDEKKRGFFSCLKKCFHILENTRDAVQTCNTSLR